MSVISNKYRILALQLGDLHFQKYKLEEQIKAKFEEILDLEKASMALNSLKDINNETIKNTGRTTEDKAEEMVSKERE